MTVVLDSSSTVLFDLDGTLVDTAPDFTAVLNNMCRAAGIAPPTAQAIHATVSSGARALVELSFRKQPGDTGFDQLLQQLLDAYGQQLLQSHAVLYPGMCALLDRLQQAGIAWGVVTNKPLRFSEPLLAGLGLSTACAVLICPDHVTRTKPDPEPLLLACQRVQCAPEKSVYIGDHPRDIDAGRAASMHTIAAAYGYLPLQPPVSSWSADFIAHQVSDIADYLWPTTDAPATN
tara:strand:- start:47152 stop:47850 length:699 start_codon:yes stop_codon:yes gene_type:complete